MWLSLFIIPALGQGASSFEQVFKAMNPVDKYKTVDITYETPFYKSLQFQYRNADTSSVELNGAERISIKLSPLAWGQREKEKELHSEYRKFSKTINLEGSARECLYRSLLFANAFHTRRSLAILEKLKLYLDDEIKILKRGVGENLFEFKELVSVREAQVKNQIRISELNKLKESIQTSLNHRLLYPVLIDDITFTNFINIEKIKHTDLAIEPKIIELKKLDSLVKINTLEYEIEKQETNKILDSIHLYRWDDKINNGISYGFEVTLNLPFFHKRAYFKDSVQRQIAINKLSSSQREMLADIEGTELNFKNKINQYEALKESDYYKTLQSLKKLLAGSKHNSPLMILQTNVKMALERLKVLDLRHDITQDYLNKLYYSGKISRCEDISFLVQK